MNKHLTCDANMFTLYKAATTSLRTRLTASHLTDSGRLSPCNNQGTFGF